MGLSGTLCEMRAYNRQSIDDSEVGAGHGAWHPARLHGATTEPRTSLLLQSRAHPYVSSILGQRGRINSVSTCARCTC